MNACVLKNFSKKYAKFINHEISHKKPKKGDLSYPIRYSMSFFQDMLLHLFWQLRYCSIFLVKIKNKKKVSLKPRQYFSILFWIKGILSMIIGTILLQISATEHTENTEKIHIRLYLINS